MWYCSAALVQEVEMADFGLSDELEGGLYARLVDAIIVTYRGSAALKCKMSPPFYRASLL
eukprot:5553385-Amphidinium_carterae.1